MWTGIGAGPRVLESRLPAGQRGRGRAAFDRVAFEGFARSQVARGRIQTRVNGKAGPERPHHPRPPPPGSLLVQGAGPGPCRCLATSRPAPAPLLAAAGASPQHGLAGLACAVPVGRQLRAAACPGPAPEPPQPPSAADPPLPVHGAQQAAALPNWVSAGRLGCGAREGGLAGTDRRRPREARGSVRVRAGGSGSKEERARESIDLGEEKSVGWKLVWTGNGGLEGQPRAARHGA